MDRHDGTPACAAPGTEDGTGETAPPAGRRTLVQARQRRRARRRPGARRAAHGPPGGVRPPRAPVSANSPTLLAEDPPPAYARFSRRTAGAGRGDRPDPRPRARADRADALGAGAGCDRGDRSRAGGEGDEVRRRRRGIARRSRGGPDETKLLLAGGVAARGKGASTCGFIHEELDSSSPQALTPTMPRHRPRGVRSLAATAACSRSPPSSARWRSRSCRDWYLGTISAASGTGSRSRTSRASWLTVEVDELLLPPLL